MAYETDNPGPMAGLEEAMGETPETPDKPKADEGKSEDTYFLPADFVGAETLNAGDEIVLKVVGKDEDGNVEVAYAPPKSEAQSKQDSWDADLESAMAEPKA